MIAELENDSGSRRPEPNRFLARQPILNRKQRVIGYEILFRSGWVNSFAGNGDEATRQTVDNLLVSGVDSICGRRLAFVNCTRESLLNGVVTLLPPRATVLEILEDVEPDREIVAACKDLKKKGYRFALDDFVMREGMKDLIKLADYIKIDFRASDAHERQSMSKTLRESKVSLLAEKIEDVTEFQIATAEGFTNFQGYFFSRPVIIARREIPPNRKNALRLLSALSRSSLDLNEVEQSVKADPALCYRILRLVNSPVYALRDRIGSVRAALMLIGEREIRKLAIVAIASSLGLHAMDALLQLSIQRARFCELLAPQLGLNPTEQYILGLLSVADAILALPMEAIVEHLPLREAIRSALLGANNPESCGLSFARRFESGNWEDVADGTSTLKLNQLDLTQTYTESVLWTDAALDDSNCGTAKCASPAVAGNYSVLSA